MLACSELAVYHERGGQVGVLASDKGDEERKDDTELQHFRGFLVFGTALPFNSETGGLKLLLLGLCKKAAERSPVTTSPQPNRVPY